MDHKIGLYIDTGYGIGEALDVEALTTVANDEFGVAVCRAEPYWSDPDKLDLIRKDIESEELTTVVIAGPSRRVFEETFKFDGVIVERINLRSMLSGASHPITKTPKC
jgi:quinone-modifying oxidoreductase subunit QmoB